MMKSLFSGVSGLKNHTVRMDVIGNNIANVNTTAYKGNTVTFRDIFYQTRSFAASGDNISGGTNPRQVGYGLALGSIDKVMTQSGFTFSDSVYDCAIQGEGFFQVMDAAGNIYYTRNGVFNVDNAGNLVDSNGYIVLGVAGDPTGIGPSSQRIAFYIPDVQNEVASATKSIDIGELTIGDLTIAAANYEVTFSAAGYGPNGNIAINITHSPVPFATMNGSVLNIQMDLTQDFGEWGLWDTSTTPPTWTADPTGPHLNPSTAAFTAAVNEAILAGGVNPGDGVLPIEISFNNIPLHGGAVPASNDFVFRIDDDNDPSTPPIINTLSFEAVVPGLHANRYEIAIRTTDNPTAELRGSWSQNVLTITVPEHMAGTLTLADLQTAVDAAAGTDQNRMLTLSASTGAGAGAAPITNLDWLVDALGGNTRRIGLHSGADSFFRTIATKMSTVVLENGRFAAPQSVRDLDLVFIDSGGVIFGEHAVHGRIILGRIDLAIFENVNGLQQHGTSYYKESLSSGPAEVKLAGSDGAGEIVSGALEMANVDLSQEFSDMIITQRGFQANSRIITVSDTMLEELINLKR